MALAVKENRLNAAALDIGGGQRSHVRSFYVSGITFPYGAGYDTALLRAAQAQGVPAWGSVGTFDGDSSWVVKRLQVQPISSDSAWIFATYVSKLILNTAGQPYAQWAIEKTPEHTLEQSAYTLGLEQIWVQRDATSGDPGNFAPKRAAPTTMYIPGTLLTARGTWITLAQGPLPNYLVDYEYCVNDADWQGLGPGYWLYMGAQTRTDDLGLTYDLTLMFRTRRRRNWLSFERARYANGLEVVIDEDTMAALRDTAYFEGVAPQADADGNQIGITIAGPYPMRNFGVFQFDTVGDL